MKKLLTSTALQEVATLFGKRQKQVYDKVIHFQGKEYLANLNTGEVRGLYCFKSPTTQSNTVLEGWKDKLETIVKHAAKIDSGKEAFIINSPYAI